MANRFGDSCVQQQIGNFQEICVSEKIEPPSPISPRLFFKKKKKKKKKKELTFFLPFTYREGINQLFCAYACMGGTHMMHKRVEYFPPGM